jgi:putative transposase
MLRMATPRSKLVDPSTPLHYHVVSRCVRRVWLCGKDPQSGKDYSHRKKWLVDRMFHLAKYFAVEVDAFAIMSNHFHLVFYYDPI